MPNPERSNNSPYEKDSTAQRTINSTEATPESDLWNDLAEQEENKAAAEAVRKKAERRLGAKVLSGVGFQDRQREIVDSSLVKERKRGEKFEGKNTTQRNEAYLERLEHIVEKDGNALEKKLWEKSVDKLIIEPENIEESYWKTQEQVLRDNGEGRIINEFERISRTRDIQKRQRESLQSWANYLGDENAPYPMWFKVYAWDGMSKMGVFDKQKEEFKIRNKHTVAPYPKLNPAVLAKVHGAISDFYGHKDEERYVESEERNEELEALVKSGNFNRLYSKFLLEQKAILPTPERTEDVRGSWVEYLPGQEEELANAAEGTPWCIADPGTARNYLEYGENEHDDDDGQGEYSSDAKFILFHLEDPETGNLAENGCASIRLGTDGQVAEISGLQGGSQQILEDSLVPIVEEKVKTLPGGEKFLEAFADKQKLIELDRKMQREEKLTEQDYQFIFEAERPIVMLNTHSKDDPRIIELCSYFVQTYEGDEFEVNPNALIKKMFESDVAKHFDKLVELGVDPNLLAKKVGRNNVGRHFDKLVELGVDPNVLTEEMNGWGLAEHFDKLVELGANPNVLAKESLKTSVAEHFDELLELGASPDIVMHRMNGYNIKKHFDRLVELGVDQNDMIKQMDEDKEFRRIEQLSMSGVAPDELIDGMSGRDISNNLDQLADLGVDPNKMSKAIRGHIGDYEFRRLAELGTDPYLLAENALIARDDKLFERAREMGVELNQLVKGMSPDRVDDLFYRLLDLGVKPDVLLERLTPEDVYDRSDRLLDLGVDPNRIAQRMDYSDVVLEREELIKLGVDVDAILKAKEARGESEDSRGNLEEQDE